MSLPTKSSVITNDRFTVSLNNVPTLVDISLTRVDNEVTAGVYHLGRLTKNKLSIKFHLRANAKRPMIWIMEHGKGIVVLKTEERALQAQTKTIVDTWLSTRILLNNPSTNTNSLPSPLSPAYVSQLLKEGHVRRPCFKTIRKTNKPFICRSTIVNQPKLSAEALAFRISARDTFNKAVDAYLATHPHVSAGSFGDYMEACFPGFKNTP